MALPCAAETAKAIMKGTNKLPPQINKLLTVQDVAHIMGVKAKTVYRWIKSGELEAVKIGRLLRITEAALQRFIERNTQ